MPTVELRLVDRLMHKKKLGQERVRERIAAFETKRVGETILPTEVLVGRNEMVPVVMRKVPGYRGEETCTDRYARKLVDRFGSERWYGAFQAQTYSLQSSLYSRLAQHLDDAEAARRLNGARGGRPSSNF